MIIKNKTILLEKLKESLSSVLPITGIVFFLCFTIAPVSNDSLMAFIVGAFLLIIGMGLFTLGTDLAMTPIGEYVGSSITKSKKLWVVVFAGFLIGTMVTISEPDLQVLAEQVPNVPNAVIIGAVAVGVGLFLVVALLRILLKIRLSHLLIGLYLAVFIIVQFVPEEFVSVAFDSGGVTTGPMTVPLIMALGVGVAAARYDKEAENDSFGLVALCSVGPILSVMTLGIIFKPSESIYTPVIIPDIPDTRTLWWMFMEALPRYFHEVGVALLPIAVFFIIFQLFNRSIKKSQMYKILIGLVYTYLGLVLFLTGVNVGFMPVGNYLGQVMGALETNWVIVPVGMLIGFFIVEAEPAVHVLNKQVYEMTSGAIPVKAMTRSLSIGVAISVGLSLTRILAGIPILYLLIPSYLVAGILTFFVSPIFTAIAFDSGGVASGPMTATFLLPLAMGTCVAVGGNVVMEAFGVVAMVAMTPLITIQTLGLYYRIKTRDMKKAVTQPKRQIFTVKDDDDIIELF